MIKFDNHGRMFEISLVVRNALGEPTRHRKTYATDSPYKLWMFYNQHSTRKIKKKKKE